MTNRPPDHADHADGGRRDPPGEDGGGSDDAVDPAATRPAEGVELAATRAGRAAIEQHARGGEQQDGEHERGDDPDGRQDAEVGEAGDAGEEVGEEAEGGGDRRQHECATDDPNRASDGSLDGVALAQAVAVRGVEVDGVVDAEADDQDGHDRRRPAQIADDPESVGAQEDRHTVGGGDGKDDDQQRHQRVGERAPNALQAMHALTGPVDKQQRQADDADGAEDEKRDLDG